MHPPGTLFCTDTFWEQYGDRVRDVAPGVDAVVLTGDEPVAATDIERITMAFFSGDAWPDRAAPFMRVSLDAPNLRWLHSMSAGVDNPVFGMFLRARRPRDHVVGGERRADRRDRDDVPARAEP